MRAVLPDEALREPLPRGGVTKAGRPRQVLLGVRVRRGHAQDPGVAAVNQQSLNSWSGSVVDDDPDVRESLRDSLEFEGYAVDTAAGGERVLHRLLVEPRPDLAIVDLMMPGTDGLEVCRRIRASGARLPVLMLTTRDGHRTGGPRRDGGDAAGRRHRVGCAGTGGAAPGRRGGEVVAIGRLGRVATAMTTALRESRRRQRELVNELVELARDARELARDEVPVATVVERAVNRARSRTTGHHFDVELTPWSTVHVCGGAVRFVEPPPGWGASVHIELPGRSTP